MNNHPHHRQSTPAHHTTPPRQTTDSGVQLRWSYAPRVGRDDGPTPPTAIDSVDQSLLRKRRHTSLEHDRRPAPVPGRIPVERTGSQWLVNAGRGTPVSLISPPPQVTMLRQPSRDDGVNIERRRESDMRAPTWQPDGAVSACPVCQTRFTFWNRKHHCRKCGRVVCAACSPHRITIPRQYIVQVPNVEEWDWDDEPASPVTRNPALGGGATVRVCNPCVPDPWTPQALPSSNSSPSHPAETREPAGAPTLENLQRASNDDLRSSRQRAERYHWTRPPAQLPSGRYRSWSHLPPSSVNNPRLPPLPGIVPGFNFRESTIGTPPSMLNPQSLAAEYHHNQPLSPSLFGSPSPSSSRPVPHRHSHSISAASMDPRRMSGNFPQRGQNWYIPTSLRPTDAPGPPLAPPKAKRVIKEEDECPVCGIELPPNERLRESHVQECISARFSTGATPPSTTAFANTINTGVVTTNTYPAVRTAAPTASSPIAGSRPRTTSYRPRGMAIYTATEKDCTNADGEAQECVICFEEFQPGDELGRMECLCKFHRVCIRSWWERKGGGSCPTHQLQE